MSVAIPQQRVAANARRWLLGFVLTQITCELVLALVDAGAALRILVRGAALGIGLVYIVALRTQGAVSPVRRWYLAVFLTLALGALHPDSAGLLARVAQFLLYLAVLSPLLWTPALKPRVNDLKSILGVVWGFHTLSALFGVLQVYFPGQFDTALSSAITSQGYVYVQSLVMTLDSGQQILRPSGLTDIPGGAAYSGVYAAVLGIGFILFSNGRKFRPLFALSVIIGVASIALSQVRAAAADAAVCVIALALVLATRRQFGKALLVVVLIGSAATGGLLLALTKASQQVEERYSSLLTDSPEEVYRANRGHFLEETLDQELVKYPLGAGSGRWGMMQNYFGDPNSDSAGLHAEIMMTGLLYDGGILLILAYAGIIGVTLWRVFAIALRSNDPSLRNWASLVFAYDIGAVALTFSYPLFVSEAGVEFWLFNALALGMPSVRSPQTLQQPNGRGMVKALVTSS